MEGKKRINPNTGKPFSSIDPPHQTEHGLAYFSRYTKELDKDGFYIMRFKIYVDYNIERRQKLTELRKNTISFSKLILSLTVLTVIFYPSSESALRFFGTLTLYMLSGCIVFLVPFHFFNIISTCYKYRYRKEYKEREIEILNVEK